MPERGMWPDRVVLLPPLPDHNRDLFQKIEDLSVETFIPQPCTVIPPSLQVCGVDFPFAICTSICRKIVTIRSGLDFSIGISLYPPS
jgi:hypothetical protein